MTAIATEYGRRRYASLGMRRLWIGTILVLAIRVCFDFAKTIQSLGSYEDVAPVLTGWVVLTVADIAVILVTRVLGEHLPSWLFWLFLAALAIVLALDIVGTWGPASSGIGLTVGVSASLSLVLTTVTRSPLEVVISAAGLTTAAGLAMWADGEMLPSAAPETAFILCQMFLPVAVVATILGVFRNLVRRETEEMLSQSAISAPRLTVGIEASEQLARLDLAAENLLSAVADGRMALPLSDEVARRAGSLATELRLHLLESRSKTWLGLAIEESALLRQDVTVDDRHAVAGLLSTRQRAALLSSLWLLHDERGVASRSGRAPIILTFEAPVPAVEGDALDVISIRVDIPGSTRMMIDPGVWQHFAQVGRYREALDSRGMRIDIRCLVPAPRGGTRGRTDA